MALNKFPSIPVDWDCHLFLGNDCIQNVFMRTRHQEVLQNIHFADNTKQEKKTKVTWMSHFKQYFSNYPKQSIDENLIEFKGHPSMCEYLKIKPLKWGFKWWFFCASCTVSLWKIDCILIRRKMLKLIEGKVLRCNCLKN